MLDTETLEWSQPEAEGPVPPPRAGGAGCSALRSGAHSDACAVHCSLSHDDAHSKAKTLTSVRAISACIPNACSGHAGAILGDTWFIVGGGNNTSGCADMYALDLSPLGSEPVQVTGATCRHAACWEAAGGCVLGSPQPPTWGCGRTQPPRSAGPLLRPTCKGAQDA